MSKSANRQAFFKGIGKSLEEKGIQFEFIQVDTRINFTELSKGLVTGFAFWSGYSYSVAFNLIGELSVEMHVNDIVHYFIDSDYVSPKIQVHLFDKFSWGYAESCWIEQGQVQKRYTYRQELQPFIHYVKHRLKTMERK
ncbi:MAG: hypothetical protein P1U56_05915 [Saprospiraceae bacterium]|nr:hypothetical protein [Saprospiraceae bacterium]